MGGNIIKQDILIVLSPKENPEQLSSMLASHGFTATTAQNVQTAFDYLNSHISAFLLLDLDLEGAIPFLEKVIDTFYDPRHIFWLLIFFLAANHRPIYSTLALMPVWKNLLIWKKSLR